mgnify:FL=1
MTIRKDFKAAFVRMDEIRERVFLESLKGFTAQQIEEHMAERDLRNKALDSLPPAVKWRRLSNPQSVEDYGIVMTFEEISQVP